MKNKKKLLLGVAAMGLVAVATGAVSTFAWYQAQSAGLKALGTTADPIEMTTETDQIQLEAANITFTDLFNLAVAEDISTSTKGLELAHYMASGGADDTHKLGTGYLDSNGGYHESESLADGASNVLAKKYNVTITMKDVSTVTDSAGNTWTLNDALEKIYDQNFKVYVDAKQGERARVFNSTAAETASGDPATYDNIVQINSGNKAINTLITRSGSDPNYSYARNGAASITYSFFVYVHGGATPASGGDPDSVVTGHVRVTVANASDSAPGNYTGA